MANPFQTASDNERVKLSQLAKMLNCGFFPRYFKCPYDALFTGKTDIAAVEAKVRKCQSDKYDSVMIEKHKYDSLMDLINRNLFDKALYVNFYFDGCIIFNLSKINPVWSKMNLVKNTVVNNGTLEKVIYNIPIEQGTYIKINYEEND